MPNHASGWKQSLMACVDTYKPQSSRGSLEATVLTFTAAPISYEGIARREAGRTLWIPTNLPSLEATFLVASDVFGNSTLGEDLPTLSGKEESTHTDGQDY